MPPKKKSTEQQQQQPPAAVVQAEARGERPLEDPTTSVSQQVRERKEIADKWNAEAREANRVEQVYRYMKANNMKKQPRDKFNLEKIEKARINLNLAISLLYFRLLEGAPLSFIVNLDESAFRLCPMVCQATWRNQDAPFGPLPSFFVKRFLTVTMAIPMRCDAHKKLLRGQIVWHGKTAASWSSNKFAEFQDTHSPSHWANTNTIIKYFSELEKYRQQLISTIKGDKALFDKLRVDLQNKIDDLPLIVVWDRAPVHTSWRTRRSLDQFFPSIIIVFIDPGCTGDVQPLDAKFFGQFKAARSGRSPTRASSSSTWTPSARFRRTISGRCRSPKMAKN